MAKASGPNGPQGDRRGTYSGSVLISMAVCVAGISGCAAARPLQGVPAAEIPPVNRAWDRSARETIDLGLLGQTTPTEHVVDTGDILGIYIDGVLGSCQCEQAIPIYHPSDRELSPSVGFPIHVRSDGAISLPMVGPISVRGLTLVQVEDLIRRTYTVDKPLLQPGRDRILVSLQKPRNVRVLVIRQEATQGQGVTGSSDEPANQKDKRGTGKLVILPAYRNDVLNAITETGGLPGIDARNTIFIFRRNGATGCGVPPMPVAGKNTAHGHSSQIRQASAGDDDVGHSEPTVPPYSPLFSPPEPGDPAGVPIDETVPQAIATGDATIQSHRVTKIPLRLAPHEAPCFGPGDVLLNDGDVVFIESREPDYFYTGGLLGNGQFELPRDYDVNVLDAVAVAEGRKNRNTFNYPPNKAIGGVSALNGDISVGASKVIVQRVLPNGSLCNIEVDLYKALRDPDERIMIRPNDRLILRYTRCEAVAAFFERHILEGVVLGASSGLVFGR